ncbi:MAG: AbrB/MazE/SpoVT family DNA-binding domain-containing protein [Promicromonosporaceae bacterium]|nr:AbrB/MazE/SpoVT family DNA-binding domain-containing protein [Promicromonosporaceae bacterium]
MTTLTITAKGQITLKKDLLAALGLRPGDKVVAEPNETGGVVLTKAPKTGSWEDVFGMFAGRVDRPVTIEEMNETIAKGWAGEL